MATVIVYILVSDPESKRVAQVEKMFENSLFTVVRAMIEQPVNLEPIQGQTEEQALELYRFKWCLQDAAHKFPRSAVIMVKDTSVSAASPETLASTISAALVRKGWDICYLAKWMDLCDQYAEKSDIPDVSVKLVRTQSPYGTQALLFTPDGRDIVIGTKKMRNGETFVVKNSLSNALNEAIFRQQIFAITTTVSMIAFDPTAALSNADYAKTMECRQPNMVKTSSNGMSQVTIWVLVGLIILLFVIIACWYYYSRPGKGAEIKSPAASPKRSSAPPKRVASPTSPSSRTFLETARSGST